MFKKWRKTSNKSDQNPEVRNFISKIQEYKLYMDILNFDCSDAPEEAIIAMAFQVKQNEENIKEFLTNYLPYDEDKSSVMHLRLEEYLLIYERNIQ